MILSTYPHSHTLIKLLSHTLLSVEGSGTYAQKFVQDHDVLVNKGEDAVLHAGAIGFPVPSYRWTLGVSVEIDVNPGSRFSTADFGRDLRIS